MRPFDDYDDRSLIENCCIKETKQQWDLGHPPQKTERAVRVHVLFTRLMFALATAYRLRCEQEATGGEPMGWQCWRRQLLQQTRDQVIVFAQGYYGIFHIAEYSLLLGVRLKDTPPGIGTPQEILAKYRLTACSYVQLMVILESQIEHYRAWDSLGEAGCAGVVSAGDRLRGKPGPLSG